MASIDYPFNIPGSYIRVQTTYYKKCMQPTVNGEYQEVLTPWSAEMLKQDLPRSYIRKISKYDGFCCVPGHLNYQAEIGSFHNLYEPLEWKAEAGDCETILQYHIPHELLKKNRNKQSRGLHL